MDPEHEDPTAAHPSTGAVRLIDVPIDEPGELPMGSAGTPSAGSTGTGPTSLRAAAARAAPRCRAGTRSSSARGPTTTDLAPVASLDHRRTRRTSAAGSSVSSRVSEPCCPIIARAAVVGVGVEREVLARRDEHVADPRRARPGRTAPNQPASIASSRVATQARAPSRSRQRPPRHPASTPGSRWSCRHRGSPATWRTPTSSSGANEHVRLVAARRRMPWSAVTSSPCRGPSARDERAHGGVERLERGDPARRLRCRARARLDVELGDIEVHERRAGRGELVRARPKRSSTVTAPWYSAPRSTACVNPESRYRCAPIANARTPTPRSVSNSVGLRCQIAGSSGSSQPVSWLTTRSCAGSSTR